MSHRPACLLVLIASLACADLNYPEPAGESAPASTSTHPGLRPQTVANAAAPAQTASADSLGPANPTAAAEVAQTALSWSDLTFLARQDVQSGEFERARERLDQAALQLQHLPSSSARRRAVFGLQARLAIALAEKDRVEEADALADELFALAELEPELGGSALIELAYSVAERRHAAAVAANATASQLDLFRIALRTAQAGSVSRERMNLAYQVATQAYLENELDLANQAIDQSLLDAVRVVPTYRQEIAGIQLLKARIALASGEFAAANAAAVAANVTFDEIEANAALRGTGEALLAQSLAEQGEVDRALAIARGAHARLEMGEPVSDSARRQILAALAHVERIQGDAASAERHLEEAMAIELGELEMDRLLYDSIADELQAVRASESASPSHDE